MNSPLTSLPGLIFGQAGRNLARRSAAVGMRYARRAATSSSTWRSAGIGAGVGAVGGFMAGGEDHHISGAIKGAALGGLGTAGYLMGRGGARHYGRGVGILRSNFGFKV